MLHILYCIVFFLLVDSPAPEFYMPTEVNSIFIDVVSRTPPYNIHEV